MKRKVYLSLFQKGLIRVSFSLDIWYNQYRIVNTGNTKSIDFEEHV